MPLAHIGGFPVEEIFLAAPAAVAAAALVGARLRLELTRRGRDASPTSADGHAVEGRD
ncbi:hypothetical protein ACGFNU_40795 [Spirillospora sp. NPDC048911]|uniref:hypothetical protein n=1 Tax=Spirillospora sp. NPDC048911 TaxID=3364527 RepID=UPI003717F6AC